MTAAAPNEALRIVCLCAAWCGVCRGYRDDFERAFQKNGLWLDVEDEAALIPEDLDVETFPTLLIARDEQVLFFGPIAPQIALAERLSASLEETHNASTSVEPSAQSLWTALRQAGKC